MYLINFKNRIGNLAVANNPLYCYISFTSQARNLKIGVTLSKIIIIKN